ncbi:DUF6146 family protein [Flavobacterium suncheonense]|uniref:Uncharacterized protein n=1 Tax=Flavobacterium suncheonense GH29-5 = DSM 17707 TaxID=1121899 RepID=A0A0A2MD59_9FLAO|nr:DUF6146 family protein [Flavobacterium suncheonense]KGO90612.1 hypothetical protein Q764_00375 [Flavobacterium suncheonense GH29-5 = DSM 17707]
MKNTIWILSLVTLSVFWGCNSTSKTVADSNAAENKTVEKTNDTIRIANDELEYEVIIIDGGFNSWLHSTAKPRNFYSQNYLEARNIPWVIEWNNRARFPRNSRERDLFLMPIDYQNGIDYGYEVNYLLYNYLVYFQLKNNIRLGGFAPRP